MMIIPCGELQSVCSCASNCLIKTLRITTCNISSEVWTTTSNVEFKATTADKPINGQQNSAKCKCLCSLVYESINIYRPSGEALVSRSILISDVLTSRCAFRGLCFGNFRALFNVFMQLELQFLSILKFKYFLVQPIKSVPTATKSTTDVRYVS